MRSRTTHKVCFEIAGVPAIVRALDTYNRVGVVQNVVVVGEHAGQVVEMVGRRFSNVAFTHQSEALGTGDAARCGFRALSGVPDHARILVVAGDKLIENALLSRMFDEFERWQADLCILVSPAEIGGSTAGRVILDSGGRPASIVELADIRLRRCRAELKQLVATKSEPRISRAEVDGRIARCLKNRKPLDEICGCEFGNGESLDRGKLLEALSHVPHDFRVGAGDDVISPNDAEAADWRNESIYLIRKDLLEFGLGRMTAANAQGEYYLTDAINAVLTEGVNREGKVRAGYVATSRPGEVMSYNNPEELLQIEDAYQRHRKQSAEEVERRLGPERFRTVDQWLSSFEADGQSGLSDYYASGEQADLEERCNAYQQLLERFKECFGGNRKVILVRSPGRINIMGRHIDWQGGHCNLMAVNREVIMAAAPRVDDRIEIRNVDPDAFPDASFSVGNMISRLDWDDWLSAVNSQALEQHLRQSAGNWSLYVEAALLRLQMAFPDRLLRGMDVVVSGNIPVAAGLSSSSALVVSTAEAAVALHDLDVLPRQFVNFCGEGEWFVGTRGGSADHAAMKFSTSGTITHVKFHEFDVVQQIPFPQSHRLVICNSFLQAKKAAGAKQAFNSRVASYLAGVQLVRKRFPQYAPLIEYVRDIAPETLKVPVRAIYEILLQIPESMTAGEIAAELSSEASVWGELARYFENAASSDTYPIRGVLLFGIAECQRAVKAAALLAGEEMAALGELMKISHDGERQYRVDDDQPAEAWSADISDGYLRGLLDDSKSEDPERVSAAQLHRQPGAYRCSTREIDAIVDVACRVPGVEGAQIAGAGLGGCAMVLVQRDAVPALRERLLTQFYEPAQLPDGIIECTPAAGSCLVGLPGFNTQQHRGQETGVRI